jgi:hypothetical protein
MRAVPSGIRKRRDSERAMYMVFVLRVTLDVVVVVFVFFSWKTFQSASANFPRPHSAWQRMRERFVDNRVVA